MYVYDKIWEIYLLLRDWWRHWNPGLRQEAASTGRRRSDVCRSDLRVTWQEKKLLDWTVIMQKPVAQKRGTRSFHRDSAANGRDGGANWYLILLLHLISAIRSKSLCMCAEPMLNDSSRQAKLFSWISFWSKPMLAKRFLLFKCRANKLIWLRLCSSACSAHRHLQTFL